MHILEEGAKYLLDTKYCGLFIHYRISSDIKQTLEESPNTSLALLWTIHTLLYTFRHNTDTRRDG